jgi:hypothetical protein
MFGRRGRQLDMSAGSVELVRARGILTPAGVVVQSEAARLAGRPIMAAPGAYRLCCIATTLQILGDQCPDVKPDAEP